ncbi:MAG: ABC transporter permease [Nitrospiria bacterium]
MTDFFTRFLPVKPVILWTDGLIFLLSISLLLLVGYGMHREPLRAPWRQISRRPLVMSAFIVLIFYAAVGLCDSIHFRRPLAPIDAKQERQYAPEVLSLLDLIAHPLRTQTERTYSAPLAFSAYTKEMLEFEDGTRMRAYPRLKFGGAHLKDPTRERPRDIAALGIGGASIGLVLWIIVCGLIVLLLSRLHGRGIGKTAFSILKGDTETAWRAIFFSILIVTVLGGMAASIGAKYHLFGTDKVGQDVFYLALKGIRTGLVIGTLTTLVMLPLAIFLGIAAGYFRGWIDDLIQYLYTTLSSVPGVLLIAAAVLILQVYMEKHAEAFSSITERADTRLLFLCIILGLTGWIGLCRLLRGETLKLREMEYVQAANALGVQPRTILIRHILPNVMHIVFIAVVLDFSGLVLAEAVLSYVGVGVDPAMISWGNMINSARLELAREPVVWWSLAAAFVFMFGLVLSANIFSDGVRDAFDPHLRGR